MQLPELAAGQARRRPAARAAGIGRLGVQRAAVARLLDGEVHQLLGELGEHVRLLGGLPSETTLARDLSRVGNASVTKVEQLRGVVAPLASPRYWPFWPKKSQTRPRRTTFDGALPHPS